MNRDDTAARRTHYQAALATYTRERRRELRLTQVRLADQIGWTQERISNLETGNYGLPSVLALSRLAAGLQTSLFHMLEALGFDQRTVARARAEAHDHENAQALLYALQRILAIEAMNLVETLDQASDMLAAVMSADTIDTLMYDPEREALVLLGTNTTPSGRHQHRIGMDVLPLANGGREIEVFQTGTPYASGNAGDDPIMLRGMTDGLGIQSLIIVPLEVDDVRRGVVLAASCHGDHFFPDDVPFLEAVARWVGMVAHRAELAERVTAEAVERARRVTAEDLITVLAHDLGNQLTPLKGHLDMLRRKAQREDQSTYLAAAHQALAGVARIGRLIGDLLDATRLDHGLFALSLARVDLVPMIDEVAHRHQSADHPIQIQVPTELSVQADGSKLIQALDNLVGNAIRHSSEGGVVTIALGTESGEHGDSVVIDVGDCGAGIPPDVVPTLFSRFSRGAQSRGLGLGLYVARGIAEAHGGTVTVQSEVRVGSTFRLMIPLNGPS